MSTERYPEVSMDETRLVPPQNTLKPEWPKKLRNLTAQELDRLMIDSDGHFYWDGKPVSYAQSQPSAPAQAKPAEGPDQQALAMLDRAAIEIAEGTPSTPPCEPAPASAESGSAPKPSLAEPLKPSTDTAIKPTEQTRILPPVISSSSDDQVRLTLSTWQSLGLGVTIFAVLLGAFGAAAYGWVTAHDWSCRAGLVTTYCPTPASAPKTSARPDLPL